MFYREANRLSRYLDTELNNNDDDEKASDFLTFAEQYLNLATLQRERLQTFEDTIPTFEGRVTNLEHLKAIRLYFGDIHFFFNCIHKFLAFSRRLLKKLNQPESPEFKNTLEYYRIIRNHFEHVDERIDKHPFYRMQFGSVSNKTIKLDNMVYDITEKALNPLYDIFEAIIKTVEIYIEPRKEHLDQIFSAMELHLQRNYNI